MRYAICRPAAVLTAGLVLLASLLSCQPEGPTEPAVTGISLAKGGPGPNVKAADPPSAPQDITLDVRVLGSGFDDGSEATWKLDGAPQTKVRTNSTRFVNNKELVANITIDPDAPIDLYDIEVVTTRGKKGIGADLFEVVPVGGKPPADPPIIITFSDGAGDNIRSDLRGSYVDGVCGVKATFNLTDARLDPDFRKIHPKDVDACGGREPRSVKVTLEPTNFSPPHELDGMIQDGSFFKVNEVELVTFAQGTVNRTAVIGGPLGCASSLRFNPNLDDRSNSVKVTKNADGTWTVATQPPPNDVAVCLGEEPLRYYHLPFSITVELK